MIQFISLKSGFQIHKTEGLKAWLIQVATNENARVGHLAYICCSDRYLLEMNKSFLNHNYYTDVITFPDSLDKTILSGEIYVSIDRVKKNASDLKIDFQQELARVFLHGLLHLVGYNDKSITEQREMRAKEDYYLHLLPI